MVQRSPKAAIVQDGLCEEGDLEGESGVSLGIPCVGSHGGRGRAGEWNLSGRGLIRGAAALRKLLALSLDFARHCTHRRALSV